MRRILIFLTVSLVRVTPITGEPVADITMVGLSLSASDAAALEKAVAERPDNIRARAKLLGYLYRKHDVPSAEAKSRHILWLVRNAPASGVLALPECGLDRVSESEAYAAVRGAWTEQLAKKPRVAAIYGNAAAFFMLSDPKSAEAALIEAVAMEPNNPEWHEKLGGLYALGLNRLRGDARRKAALEAFRRFEIAYGLTDDSGRDSMRDDLAKMAFAAGVPERAAVFAEDMLKNNPPGWNHGNNIHHGNLILGRVALAKGDVAEAKRRLILAGKTKGSPQLNTFGPNMQLAKELLEKGERDVVLEYFGLCAKFWKSGRERLDQWSDLVKDDMTPYFGANLSY